MKAVNRKTINTKSSVSPRRKLVGTVKCHTLDEVIKGHSIVYINRDCTIAKGDRESYLKNKLTTESKYCCSSCRDENEYRNRKKTSLIIEEMLCNNGVVDRLKNLVANGICIAVVGKDIVNVNSYFGDSLEDKLSLCYQDQTIVFNQEMCLYTMLVLKEKDYPWRL